MSNNDPARILIVDDTQAIHDSIRGVLDPPQGAQDGLDDLESDLFDDAPAASPATSQHYLIDSAMQGQDALGMVQAAVAEDRSYAVAFVDMRMPPGWDGLTTIQHLWKADPAIQIVICTAYSDRSWNEIRSTLGDTDQLLILKKPFDPVEVGQLALSLSRKWAAVAAERALLADTLGSSLDVMGDLVSIVSPVSRDRSQKAQHMVRHMASQLGLRHWAYALAARVSQLGCLTLPIELVESERANKALSGRDTAMFKRHPSIAGKLIRQIPRLGIVADIVERQLAPLTVRWDRLEEAPLDESDDRAVVAVGSQMLHTALALDRALQATPTVAEAIVTCEAERHPEPLLEALRSYQPPADQDWIYLAIPLGYMKPGMILDEDVTTPSGSIVCPASTRITVAMVERLHNFAVRVGIRKEFRVRVPAQSVAAR